MAEFIFRIDNALFNEETGEVCMKPEVVGKIVRCRDCKYATDDDVDTTRFWCGYKWPAFMVPGDGYCFRGEREDG